MSLRGYKPVELFRRTMLTKVTNPSRNDTECQEDSQGNSLAAGVEQVSDDVELTGESLDETNGSTGGVVLDQRNKSKGKRKAANCPDSSAKKAKKQAWTPKAVDVLLKYIKEYKTKCEFNGVDFEADLSGMYTEVRRCLAVDFPHNFGPESCHDPGKELKDMDSEEYESYRKRKGRAQVSTVLLAEIAPGITLHM